MRLRAEKLTIKEIFSHFSPQDLSSLAEPNERNGISYELQLMSGTAQVHSLFS